MVGRFQDKVVIVTGSSNGIGRAAAQLFAEQGAKLTITGRSSEALAETRRLVLAAGSSDDRIVQVVGDLTDESIQKTLIQQTVDKFGQIDVLVNNAGASAPDQTTVKGLDQGNDIFDYIINLNTKVAINLTKDSYPYLKQTKGSVIMISSICGLARSWSMCPYYAASKAALDQIMRAMAITYIADGVRVNSINPGFISTTIIEKQGLTSDMARAVEAAVSSDPMKIPAGKVGEGRDIAEAIAFLADPKTSSFIVGHTLVVDGGSSISNPMSQNPFEKKE